ncbi:uncharacterized protein LOC6552557 [Drosophila erecta]|uniref:GG21437 n=1 Tax=Drosophila erecta TaxID=7220 RepID=B3P0M7_DROER|nr:uncharacterized protein LOC6552557 [Drosophila erecta]EDV48853.1 uncharacterized protein Dere_GG21437 [Drosophila erecta]
MDSGNQDEDTDFLFDIVVTSLDLYKPVNEPEQLEAQVKFGGANIKITSSRINVREFENNRVTELTLSPSALRQSLESQGMQISARYAGSSLGSNVLLFPDTFIDKISPTMNDLFFEDTINLMRRVDCIGTISIRLVLIVKCTNLDIIKEPRRSSSRRSSRKSSAAEVAPKMVLPKENCQGLGPTFNAQDIMFVIGDPDPLLKIPLEPCSELAFEEGDVRLDLDLQRYRSLENRRVVYPDDDPCPKDKPSISQLRQLIHHYSRLIGVVSDKINQMNVHSSSVDPPSVDTHAPSSSTPKEPVEDRRIPVPIKDDTDNDINPIRFCPFCLCSMSWLPKYANCPNCNAAPLPVLQEHHSHKLTADEIVEELLKPKQHKESDEIACRQCQDPIIHTKKLRKKKKPGLGEPTQVSESDSGEECPPCRCTCSAEKTCAHCRIRKMCEDVFNGENENAQEQETHIEVPQPCKGEDFCVISNPSDDRPYLSRVLNELKDLYHLHDTKKLLDMQKRCESQTLLPIEIRPSISLKHAPNGFDPHVPGTLNRQTAGHKTCLPETHYVPRQHGWDWPRSWLARKYGWRPGAILRAAGQVMRYFLLHKKGQRRSAKQDDRGCSGHPILNVCKKDGVILVTLRALATSDMKQRPITFRIVKSELAEALRQIKRALKDQGFRKCTCHKSLMLCTCRDALEKFELNKALKKECQRRIMEPCPEHLVLTDTSISDLEFNLDVTPPTGTPWPISKALPNVVSHGTQTQRKGKPSIEPKYPLPDSPYWRAFDCAAADHYMGTAFGDNLETVFEDGIFGYRGGGQHGRAPCGRDPRIWGKRTGAPMPIGTAHDAIDPYRFTRSVWKTLPRNIIRQMHTNRKL